MDAALKRSLPQLRFPLLALLSLLRDALLAAVLLLLHSLALLPRLALHALRPSPPEPGCEFYEGTITHTRHVPLHHSFTYPVRNVLVDLDAPPKWFARQKPDCLTADEARALAGTDGAVKLLTYAPSCGYEQNPISVYYCYPREPPGAPPFRALAEVTNTPWGERVRFAFALGEDVLPKPLHVSPLMAMSPAWRITSEAPDDALRLSFCVEAPAHAGALGGGGALFAARLALRRVAVGGLPEAWAWGMPHRVALWIYWQAFRLLAKGVPFQSHPKYSGRTAYRRAAAEAEKPLRRVAAGARAGGCPAFQYREATVFPWTLQ